MVDNETEKIDNNCGGLENVELKYILSAIYIGLGVVGSLGNISVIVVVLRVIFGRGVVTNVYIYVLCLSCIDFAYSSTGPFIVTYLIRGTWIFGNHLCRVMYICEGLNKTLSVYLLVVLSGDRYLAACRPYTSTRYRSITAALFGLGAITVAVIFTNIPIYMFTTVRESDDGCRQCGVWFPWLYHRDDQSSTVMMNNFDSQDTNVSLQINLAFSDIYQLNVTTNVSNLPPLASPNKNIGAQWLYSGTYYLILLLTLYFITPASMIVVFYAMIVKRIRQQQKLLKKSSSKRNRVTKSVLAVVSFYFICWTPYWCLQGLITFWPQLQYTDQETFTVFGYFAYFIYALPYVNSSLDPILYAFLNKRLWLAYAASRAGRRPVNGTRLPGRLSSAKENLSTEFPNDSCSQTNNQENNKLSITVKSTDNFGTIVERLSFLDN